MPLVYAIVALVVLLFAGPSEAQVHVDIGIHLPAPPQVVIIPGVPAVHYASAAPANIFLYGDQYWIFADGSWYVSRHHAGPWILVGPQFVPRPLLLVPVGYYRVPPGHWKQWNQQAAPRWEQEWGPGWADKRGWRDGDDDRVKSKGKGHGKGHAKAK